MSKRLLVGSVYASGNDRQQEWFGLQSAYLESTTQDFDHVIYVNHSDVRAFNGVKVIGIAEADPTKTHGSVLHLNALRGLHRYFLSVQDDYDTFLFLDNDAFPIRKDWEHILSSKMEDRDIAVIVRPELCEFRWHASVLFTTKNGLNNLVFEFSHMRYLAEMGKDFLGNTENDIHINYQAAHLRDKVFPLIRTNMYNVHPVACGVYYDMFYHHTFGSEHGLKADVKPFESLRYGGKYGYGDFYTDAAYPYREFYAALMRDAPKFIGNLAGWSKSAYAEVESFSKQVK